MTVNTIDYATGLSSLNAEDFGVELVFTQDTVATCQMPTQTSIPSYSYDTANDTNELGTLQIDPFQITPSAGC